MSRNSALDADQLEFKALHDRYAVLNDGLLDNKISGEIDDAVKIESFGGTESEWAAEDAVLDSLLIEVREEIEHRAELLGEIYPFELSGDSIQYKPGENLPIYELCLSITQVANKNGKEWQELSVLFEELCTDLTKSYFHADVGVRTGAPFGRLKDQLEKIFIDTEELGWDPDPKFIVPGRVKDHGIDLIAYRNLLDNRFARMFIFGQCACGQNWDDGKEHDLSDRKIGVIVKRFPAIRPILTFWIPYQQKNELPLNKVTKSVQGPVFDRCRITKAALISDCVNGYNERILEAIQLIRLELT